MVKKERRKQGRPPSAEEKAYIAEWFSRHFKDGNVSHSQYAYALTTDMRKEGYDTGSINKEKFVDAMRSRIRAHRKGGPAYGAESVRRKLSPLKDRSKLAMQFFKKHH